jgi:hypothetical protein
MAQFVTGSVLTAASLNSQFNTQTIATATSNYTLGSANAGELVLLTSASAGTVTIPLDATYNFATGTIIEMYNSGAGSWSIATAGTASTVAGTSTTLSQYQASRLIKTAPSTWFVDGGASTVTTPGLSLITPTTIANSGGTASLSGGAVTLSGVSSVSLNGVFSASYAQYVVKFYGTTSATNTTVNFRLRASGTDATGSNYNYQNWYFQGASGNGGAGSNTSMRISTSSTTDGIVQLELANPFATAVTNLFGTGGYYGGVDMNAGYHTLSTSYDGCTLFPGSGTFSGTIRVFGYKA